MSIHFLSDHDKASISLLDRYPRGSAIVLVVLTLALYSGIWPGRSPQHTRMYSGEIVSWKTHAAVFNFPLDPPTFAPGEHLADFVNSITDFETQNFRRCFFKDASRSRHYAVDANQHNAVTGRCLSFLSITIVRNHRLKTRPWFSRLRNKTRNRSIPYQEIRFTKGLRPEDNSTGTVSPLMCLRVALFYLPLLLHSATHSQELITLSKRWLGLAYMRHPFPKAAKRAEEAVKRYLYPGIRIQKAKTSVLTPAFSWDTPYTFSI